MTFKVFGPVRTQCTAGDDSPRLFRVPVCYDPIGDSYTVYVGDTDWLRCLQVKDLPEELTHKLALIRARTNSTVHAERKDSTVITRDLYINDFLPKEFDEIGWRATKNWFCAVITPQCLDLLRCEVASEVVSSPVQTTGDDYREYSRIQSKSKG